MNRNVAIARLGLTDAADANSITSAYSECMANAQQQLVASQTNASRQQSQVRVGELIEAYELLIGTQRNTLVAAAGNATVIRFAGESDGVAETTMPAFATSPGTVLADRLEIGALLGHGGMGNVYAAHDRLKDEDVAIKVLRHDLTLSAGAKERFLTEAKLSCSLSHPNIVRVHDVGISGGHYYFSMERLKGQTLRKYMQTCQRAHRQMRLDEILSMMRQLFEALEYAHRYIVHRDLKPENIWLAEDGTVKLMDFGIARAYSHSQVTQTGMTLGTVYYMAPEQQNAAQEVDWRADQYSLGGVLYEMLSGTVPMGAATPLAKLRRDLPRRAAQAIMRAMAPLPNDRWPSLDELSQALHAQPSNVGKITAAVLVTIGILAGGKLAVDDFRTVAAEPATLSGLASYRANLLASEIVLPTDSAVLSEPGLFDIVPSPTTAFGASSATDGRSSTATLAESEIIETEFMEPERIQPSVQQPVVQQPVAPRQLVRDVPRPAATRPYPEPRFDARRPPPEFRPPPPRGTRPPPHPDPRRPPRR
jgi:serine/threonine protein kinase